MRFHFLFKTALCAGLLIGSAAAKADVMSCEELTRLRDDDSAWLIRSGFSSQSQLGWRLRSTVIVATLRGDVVEKSFDPAMYLDAEPGMEVGVRLKVLKESERLKSNQVRYLTRWISRKRHKYDSQPSRCSPEIARSTAIDGGEYFQVNLTTADDLDDRYELVSYDGNKNILHMLYVVVTPKKREPVPTASDENAAALRVAYKTAAFLEKCDGLIATGQPLSEVRARLAKIEKSAAASKLDLGAAKRKAMEDAKGDLDMFDMFGALSPLNYEQRNSLKQFCALNAMNLLDASKHFAELDRVAGR